MAPRIPRSAEGSHGNAKAPIIFAEISAGVFACEESQERVTRDNDSPGRCKGLLITVQWLAGRAVEARTYLPARSHQNRMRDQWGVRERVKIKTAHQIAHGQDTASHARTAGI